jgi:hypothetical protein
LFLVLRSLSRRKSIASMVPIGLRIRRSTYIFFNTCESVIRYFALLKVNTLNFEDPEKSKHKLTGRNCIGLDGVLFGEEGVHVAEKVATSATARLLGRC